MKDDTSEQVGEECEIEPRPMGYAILGVGIVMLSAGIVVCALYGIWRLAHG